MSRIRVLPDHLVNQIAAGEVVERPASVVKELLENSIDAGALAIAVEVEGGGRRRIRVTDDGEGLDRDDALLALERHATSKLAVGDELARIETLGFRGEALPSIASVSRLTLQSSRDGGTGTRVETEAGRLRGVTETAHPRGTTVDVRDLFFNTPARAKFLKSTATELGHISDLLAACCVSIPRIRVSLSHEGRNLLDVPPTGDEGDRLLRAYGPQWGAAIPFRKTRGRLTARGLILPPAGSVSSRRLQHFYVNGRLVKDRLIGHAIASACERFFPKDRHAALFLFIECPAEAVDVNVHPAKSEVRFAESRSIHDLVGDAVAEALAGAMPVTVITADAPSQGGEIEKASAAVHEAMLGYMAAHPAGQGPERELWRMQGAAMAERPKVLPGIDEGAVPLAHYLESYIIAADLDGLLIVDQHAAHERILFDRLMSRLDSEPGANGRQALLFPITVEVPRGLIPRIGEAALELERLGFTTEAFGETTLIVREAPSLVPPGDLTRLLSDLLDQMAADSEGEEGARLPRREKLVATVACHAAIKVRMPLTADKMNYLIKELFRTSAPLKCPHGRPAVLRFSRESIEKGFDRR
ncbi:MAG TPA: DNA mismatch repair endonuclease MutL [Candidatus Polarisedimenticolia bacterium]